MSIRRPAVRKTGKCFIRQREGASNMAHWPQMPPGCLARKRLRSNGSRISRLSATPPTGRSIEYGAVAGDAAGMPVPEKIALKRPQDFKLIGTPPKRLDTPAKVNGTAVYGIDVRPSGVKIATLAPSPVFGAAVEEG